MVRVRTTLNKPTRAKSAVDALRALILEGEFSPGDRLQEQMLADRLQVSRTPVHAALSTLALEGLIVHEPHCGFVVRKFELKDVTRAIDVRIVLEGLAAKCVATLGLDEQTRTLLLKNLEESERTLHGRSWNHRMHHRWFNLNRQFHDAILSRAENPYLTNAVAQVRAIPSVYDHTALNLAHGDLSKLYRREQSQQALLDHRGIFEALDQQQVERAEFLLKDHIFKNRAAMIKNFQGSPARGPIHHLR
jgi:GntR family transcriptional regulator of vanillate catabolism